MCYHSTYNNNIFTQLSLMCQNHGSFISLLSLNSEKVPILNVPTYWMALLIYLLVQTEKNIEKI